MPFWYTNLFFDTTSSTSTTITIPYQGGLTNSTYSHSLWTIWTRQQRTDLQNSAWQAWTQTSQIVGAQDSAGYAPTAYGEPLVRTAAEIADEERQRREYLQEAAKRRRILDEIEARAEALLLEHLTEEQRHDYRTKKHFIICGKSGSRYRVQCARGISGNIELLNAQDVQIGGFCAHAPNDSMVGADHFLAQALNLRHNEEEFLRVANRHY